MLRSAKTFPLFSVLAAELGPFPGRWRSAFRISLACVIVVVVAMTLRTPLTWIPLYLCFALSRDTVAETVLGGVLVVLLAAVGVGVALPGLHYAAEPAWLRLGVLAVLMICGLFMDRATIIPLAGPNLALVWGMIFTLPDAVPFPEIWVRFCLWFLPLAFMGAGAAILATLLLPPVDPLKRLLSELGDRIRRVETVVSQRCGPGGNKGAGGRDVLLGRGMSPLLELVKMIELQHPAVKRSTVDLRGLITLVDRLGIVAESLRLLPRPPLPRGQQARLRQVVAACSRLRRVLETRRKPDRELWAPPRVEEEEPLQGGAAGALPAIFEMEQILKSVSLTFRSRNLDVSQSAPKPERKYGIFLADAFSNPEYIQFALKGTLAAFACYFIYTATDYGEIHTSLITCMVVALSTSGAVIHKMALRITGACIGGAMAVASVVFLIPHMDSLTPLCLLIGAGSLVAAWVAAGSQRISYAGWQIGLAFFMTVIQGSGPADDLTVIRDRLIGILLGNVMMGLIFTCVFPERAGAAMWRSLSASLRTLARLIGVPGSAEEAQAVLRGAEPVRRQFYEEIEKTQAMTEQAIFEPKAFFPAGKEARQGVLYIAAEAEAVALLFQTVILHRDDTLLKEVPETARRKALEFHGDLQQALGAAADILEGRPSAAPPDLQGLEDRVTQVETVLRRAAEGVSEETAHQIEGRIALYQRMARRMRRLILRVQAVAAQPWSRETRYA